MGDIGFIMTLLGIDGNGILFKGKVVLSTNEQKLN